MKKDKEYVISCMYYYQNLVFLNSVGQFCAVAIGVIFTHRKCAELHLIFR